MSRNVLIKINNWLNLKLFGWVSSTEYPTVVQGAKCKNMVHW